MTALSAAERPLNSREEVPLKPAGGDMHSNRAVPQTNVGLAELLGGCVAFNGVWPTNLNLYPTFWQARLRQGRGIGVGLLYRPWLKVRDLGSRGTSHVVLGIKSGRRHHLLSDYELLYFYLVERRKRTCQILEQWPILDLENTMRLSSELSVRHPYARGVPEPVTVDFLVTEHSENGSSVRAVAVKSPDDSLKPNVLRQLAVQERWCATHGLFWALADMSGVRDVRTTLESLKFLRWWFRFGASQPSEAESERFIETFLAGYRRDETLGDAIMRTGKAVNVRREVAIQTFRHAGWHADIPVDLQSPIRLDMPVVLLNDN
jgi:hypothetical protein